MRANNLMYIKAVKSRTNYETIATSACGVIIFYSWPKGYRQNTTL
jgi:hypothetical protein